MPDALQALAADARWLLDEAEVGDWSRSALAAVSAARGLAGDVVVFDGASERYSGGRECRELVIPVPAAFRAARDVFVAELGPADSFGDHGRTNPWFAPAPGWGAPFLRWRRPGSRLLELRATPSGVDLVLQPVEPYEAWRADTHEWSDLGSVTGFVAERNGPNNEGLFTPGVPRAANWKKWQGLIPEYLAALPAVTAALGEHVHLQFFFGNSSRVFLTSTPGGELFLRVGREPSAAGWYRSEERFMPWRYDAGGPGEVDGPELAGVLVAALQEEKVKTVGRLFVLRGSEVRWSHFGLFLG